MNDKQALLDIAFSDKHLSQPQAYALFNGVMRGELSEVELTAVLIALKMKRESPNEIAGAASAMIANAKPFVRPDYHFSDIVGTGGDGHNTINISSSAAVVAASCGVKVAKHGNRSVSSKSGSADLFREFGLNLETSPEQARACLDQANFCFLFAPVYHSGVRHAMPVRTALKTRTLFNILGPLANPAGPTHGVFGVYTPELLEAYAQTLMLMGQQRALIVHGAGLDELALHGESQIVDLEHGDLKRYTVTAEDFGLKRYDLDSIKGGEPEENRAFIAEALAGKGQEAHRAAIAMNASALLVINDVADNFAQGTDMAMAAMAEGSPLKVLEKAAEISHKEANQ